MVHFSVKSDVCKRIKNSDIQYFGVACVYISIRAKQWKNTESNTYQEDFTLYFCTRSKNVFPFKKSNSVILMPLTFNLNYR